MEVFHANILGLFAICPGLTGDWERLGSEWCSLGYVMVTTGLLTTGAMTINWICEKITTAGLGSSFPLRCYVHWSPR